MAKAIPNGGGINGQPGGHAAMHIIKDGRVQFPTNGLKKVVADRFEEGMPWGYPIKCWQRGIGIDYLPLDRAPNSSVEGHEPEPMHEAMATALDVAVERIKRLQQDARSQGKVERPRWPMISCVAKGLPTQSRRGLMACRSRAPSVRTKCHYPIRQPILNT